MIVNRNVAASGAGNLLELQSDTGTKIEIHWDGGAQDVVTVKAASATDDLELEGGIVRFKFSNSQTRFEDDQGDARLQHRVGALEGISSSTGSVVVALLPGTSDAMITAGGAAVGSHTRGVLDLRRDSTTNATRQSIIKLEDEDGADWFLWVSTAGKLLIDSTDPGETDVPGSATVVGNQS